MNALAALHQFADWNRAPETPVGWQGDSLRTDAELRLRVQNLMQHLPATPGQRWLLWCDDGFEFLVGLLALWQCGHCAVLPANAQAETLASVAADCNGWLSDVLPQAVNTWQQATREIPLRQALPLDATALQLFTSGSTGAPKAVTRTLRQLQAELQALQQQFPLPAATVLATVPHHHIYGLLFRLLWPLAAARPFVATPEHYPEPLLGQIKRHAPVLLISSPAHLERLPSAIDLTAHAPDCLAVFSSGAPLPRAAALQLQQALGKAPLEVLGSTETGGVAWRQRDAATLAATDAEPWQLLPAVQARLNADAVLEVLSPAAEKQQWCALGDRAELLADGRFVLLGRADRIVKIEAKRLSLTELEQQLQTHEWVDEAAALVLEGSRTVVAVVARLTPAGAAALAARGKHPINEALRQHLANRFERVLLPKRFRYVEAMPRDDRGKLTQQALRALFAEESLS
ncbi:MAG: AMP-binding protein [Permianibacter sp.]